jgi:hypothetical protein
MKVLKKMVEIIGRELTIIIGGGLSRPLDDYLKREYSHMPITWWV